MSQAASLPPEDLEYGDSKVDGHRDSPHSVLTENYPLSPGCPFPGDFDGGDSTWPLFSMYCKIAEEEDNKLIEGYRRETDWVLIFAGLFIATLTALIIMSLQDVRPNARDTSAFYLKNIYQLLANQNVSQASISETSILATPSAFSPPVYAVWVNLFWFLSLSCSLTSAGSAMLLRQWTQRYVMVTQQPWLTPDQRARAREMFSNYAHGHYVFWGITPMVFFLYLSMAFFIVGGLIYLFFINRTLFAIITFWAVMLTLLISFYTAASISKPEMLFYTPISPIILPIYLGLSYTVFQVSSRIPLLHRLCEYSKRCYHNHSQLYYEGFLEGKWNIAKEATSKRSSEIDSNVLEWTFKYVVEDGALETFFGAIPGFSTQNWSTISKDAFRTGFGPSSGSTFTKSVRGERLVICLNAARAALGSGAVSHILDNIFDGRWPPALQSIEVGHALKRWDDTQFSLRLRRIVARIVSRIQVSERDDRWIALVQDEFGIPDHALQNHVSPCDGDSLAILTHIIRQLLRTNSPPWDPDILQGFGNFDIHNIPLSQQQDLCTTWNEVVREAQCRGAGSMPVLVLKEIEHIHAGLHQRTRNAAPGACSGSTAGDDAILPDPLSDSLCSVVDRRLDLTADPHLTKGPAEDASFPLSTFREVPDVIPFPTPIPTPTQPVPLESRSAAVSPDVAVAAVPVATTKIYTLSCTANCIVRPTIEGGLAQRRAQDRKTPILSSIEFDSPPPPSPSISSLSNRAIHSTLAVPVDAIVRQPDYIAPTLGTSSSSPSSDATCLSVPPHVSTFLDQSPALGVGGAGTHSDTRDPNLPISLEVYPHPHKSAPPTPNIATNTPRRESKFSIGQVS